MQFYVTVETVSGLKCDMMSFLGVKYNMHIGLGFLAFILCLLFLSRPAAGGEGYVDKLDNITPYEASKRHSNNYNKGYSGKRNYKRRETSKRSNKRRSYRRNA
jgi:hypothetical protein